MEQQSGNIVSLLDAKLMFIFIFLLAFLLRKFYHLDCDISLAFLYKFTSGSSNLKGKVVWITGASGGIGQSLAVSLARSGCKLILSGRNLDKLEQTRSYCLSGSDIKNADICIKAFDLKDTEKHEHVFEDVLNVYQKVDILVNNAGLSQRANFNQIDIRVDRDIFETNVFGGVNLTRILINHWIKKNISGQIVVTSSIVGKTALPYCSSYTASKHALHGYYECVRAEYSTKHIKVTMICSGPVKTNINLSSYTETYGKKLESKLSSNDNRMSTERHGQLMSLAIACKIEEAWISKNPFLLFCYLNQYWPTISKRYLQGFARYLSSARDQ